MRFPGHRKRKHYFPVDQTTRPSFEYDVNQRGNVYIVGLDQLLVDIEATVSEQFLQDWGIKKGESQVLEDASAEAIYEVIKRDKLIQGEFAGGAVGNTLHNYSVLADDRSVILGVMSQNITVGDYAFNYLCSTSSRVDLSHCQPIPGPMGRAFCFVTPDGERSFGISRGNSYQLSPDFVKEEMIGNASVLLLSAFLLRFPDSPIYQSVLKAVEIAKSHHVPIVLSMGTSSLVADKREFFIDFIRDNVNVLAMNLAEATALTGETDPLLAGQHALGIADLALITVGSRGLYLCAHVDESVARETEYEIHSKSIPEYNRFEFSRSMYFDDCDDPLSIFSHVNPYLGGPVEIKNTNGAGDAALAALLHDMAANRFHRIVVPNSPKHSGRYLTYSSIAQICKYCNRVSYEVLSQNGPRLYRGLPQREDSLDESFWDK